MSGMDDSAIVFLLREAADAIERLSKGIATEREKNPLDFAGNVSVRDSGMCVRAINVCEDAGADTLGKVSKLTASDLCEIRNCGIGTLNNIAQVLASHGLKLKCGYTVTPET